MILNTCLDTLKTIKSRFFRSFFLSSDDLNPILYKNVFWNSETILTKPRMIEGFIIFNKKKKGDLQLKPGAI